MNQNEISKAFIEILTDVDERINQIYQAAMQEKDKDDKQAICALYEATKNRFIVIDNLINDGKQSESIALSRSIFEAMVTLYELLLHPHLGVLKINRANTSYWLGLITEFDQQGIPVDVEERDDVTTALAQNTTELLQFLTAKEIKELDDKQKYRGNMLGKNEIDIWKEMLSRYDFETKTGKKIEDRTAWDRKIKVLMSTHVHLSYPFVGSIIELHEQWLRTLINNWFGIFLITLAQEFIKEDLLAKKIQALGQ